jgi:addiction module HigA family antidote
MKQQHANNQPTEILANSLTPAAATPPGQVLHNELVERGISAKEFCTKLGLTEMQFQDLLTGKRAIDESTAKRLENLLGISSTTWLNLQNRFEINAAYGAKVRNLQ